jgi:triphosphoribosyl-dephospho-CoA synthetase
MVKDAAQVQVTAQRLVDMNTEGTLGTFFAPLVELSQLDDVLGEEGWVLGVT